MIGIVQQRQARTVVKISAFCSNSEDCWRLLESSKRLRTATPDPIVLGMGLHGLPTRLLGLVWDSYLTFTPESLAEASAPGQLALPQYLSIVRQLEVSSDGK